MTSKIEVTNKNLVSLAKQFKEKIESPRKEVSNKLMSEVSSLIEDINQLREDTGLEVTNIRENVNTVPENLDDKINENMSEVQRPIQNVSQKLDKEIEALKVRLDAKQACEDLSVAGSSELNTVDVNSNSHNTSTRAGSVGETRGRHNESTCSDAVNVAITQVKNANDVSAVSEMPSNCDTLNELSLPGIVNNNKQSVVTFLRDLDMYFELKEVPENLKLPLGDQGSFRTKLG